MLLIFTCDFPAALAGVELASGDFGWAVGVWRLVAVAVVPLSSGFEIVSPCFCVPIPIWPWSNELDGDPPLGEREGDFTCTYILNIPSNFTDYLITKMS